MGLWLAAPVLAQDVPKEDRTDSSRPDPKVLQQLLPKPPPGPPPGAPPRPRRPGETFRIDSVVTVRLKPGADLQAVLNRAESRQDLLKVVRRPNRLGYVDLQLASGDASKSAQSLARDPDVASSEPNWVGAYSAVTPNDPFFPYQWALANAGGFSSVADADIDADDAWSITQGNSGVIVAVIDCGVEWWHPDLWDHMWMNSAEVSGVQGSDDESNGFIDDYAGWDFDTNSFDISCFTSHGTQIAGIIGAIGGNGVGVAGIAGGGSVSDGCRIMALGVGDPDPRSSCVDDAILYAVAAGAKVINLSFAMPRSTAVADALRFAHDQGVVITCAVGNYYSSVTFPASDEHCIPVASLGASDLRSIFSSPGSPLDLRGLAAPGEDILTLDLAGGYAYVSGTSVAAPHVAGAAALILSTPRGAGMTPDQIRDLLRSTADPVAGTTSEVGKGRLNVNDALLALPP